MFIIFLRFTAQKDKVSSLMQEHNAWIDQGLREGVDERLSFLLGAI